MCALLVLFVTRAIQSVNVNAMEMLLHISQCGTGWLYRQHMSIHLVLISASPEHYHNAVNIFESCLHALF